MFQYCNSRTLVAQAREISTVLSPAYEALRYVDTRCYGTGQVYAQVFDMKMKMKAACMKLDTMLYLDRLRKVPDAIARKDMTHEVMQIVNHRWDDMVRNELHAVAHLLHPIHLKEKDVAAVKRSKEGVAEGKEVDEEEHAEEEEEEEDEEEDEEEADERAANKALLHKSFHDLVTRWFPGKPVTQMALLSQLEMFKKRDGIMGGEGSKFAINDLVSQNKMSPAQWWSMFGGEVPMLQSLAVKVLSQPNTSSECERCFSLFGAVNRKNRRRMSVKKMSDTVRIAYSMQASRWADKQAELRRTILLQCATQKVNVYGAQRLLGVSSGASTSTASSRTGLEVIFGDEAEDLMAWRAAAMEKDIQEDIITDRETIMELAYLNSGENVEPITGFDDNDGQDDGDRESEGGKVILSDQQVDDLGMEICVSVGSAEDGDEGCMPPSFTYI